MKDHMKRMFAVLAVMLLLFSVTGCSKGEKHDTGSFTIRLADGWAVHAPRYSPDLSGGNILKLEKRSAKPLGEGKTAYYPVMVIERHEKGYVKPKDEIHFYRNVGTVKIGNTEYEVIKSDYLGSVFKYITYEKGNNTFIVLISVTLEGKFIDLSFEDEDIKNMILSLK